MDFKNKDTILSVAAIAGVLSSSAYFHTRLKIVESDIQAFKEAWGKLNTFIQSNLAARQAVESTGRRLQDLESKFLEVYKEHLAKIGEAEEQKPKKRYIRYTPKDEPLAEEDEDAIVNEAVSLVNAS